MRIVALLVGSAAGHSMMTKPPPRTNMTQQYAGHCAGAIPPGADAPVDGTGPQNGPCDWYNQGCQPGCSECNVECGHIDAALGKCCDTPMEPTVTDSRLRTMNDMFGLLDVGFKYNPWRSPGFAPILDPCGEAAGGEPGASIDGIEPGAQGSVVLPENLVGTSWAAGSTQEVSWSLYANHGGGYSYRLCPKTEKLTEACFQSHPLDFVGDSQWIQFGDDVSNRTAIPATRTSEGTNPQGSQWTKNPIPPCSQYTAGADSRCSEPQFGKAILEDVIPAHPKFAPTPGLYGFGPGALQTSEEMKEFWTARFNFNIVDQVSIPSNLISGDYVLGFRWDAEQTPQIWQNCADLTITAPETQFV